METKQNGIIVTPNYSATLRAIKVGSTIEFEAANLCDYAGLNRAATYLKCKNEGEWEIAAKGINIKVSRLS